MARQTVRTLVDLISGINIVQVTDKRLVTLAKEYDISKKEGFLYGFYDYKNTVYIRKNMCHEDKVRTLLHELMHVYSKRIVEVDGKGEWSEKRVESEAAKIHNYLYTINKKD